MESVENFEQNINYNPSMESSEALSGLLSVVNALCTGRTENNENDDEDDDGNRDYNGDNGVLNDDDCVNDDDDDDDNDDDDDENPCFLETASIFDKHDKRKIQDKEMVASNPSLCGVMDSEKQMKRQAQNSSLLPTEKIQTINIPTYCLDETRIIIFPDVYTAVRRACGTCSTLRSQINKLGIVAKRFHPWQMTRLKHVGAIALEVKCCSYISLEEFLHIIQNYKDESVKPEMFNFLPAANVITSTPPKSLVEEKVGKSGSSTDSTLTSLTSSPLHTFIVNDQVVVCTVELQQVFEALFGKVFCVSLTKLGVFQKKFTPCQLDEVMDFVDIDESSVSSASFYVTKKDGERVFRYAEALFNVDQITVKWMEPLKLTDNTEVEFPEGSTGGTALERSSSLPSEFSRNPSTIHSIPESIHRPRSMNDEASNLLPDYFYSSSDESLDASPSNIPSRAGMDEEFIKNGDTPARIDAQESDAGDITVVKGFPVEKSPTRSTKNEKDHVGPNMCASDKFNHTTILNCSLESSDVPANADNTPQPSSSGLIPTNEEYPSSPDSEASSISDLGTSSSIRTYEIDGNEVVCMPDIHKIVIHLYGQSVQVGYYLQRLQIPTQRFSTVHVKRLKALKALNSKATLCTYILKSDAQRLLKMYDVFCTESKLQQIHWSNPVSLDVFEGAIPFKYETPTINISMIKRKPIDPIDVVKIPTFQINGEVVVSVPDAHKVIQVLNGQSVQVRYNMDKLGIVRRKYSYSQVYQLRAISDLKRPSMCTFITKTDADKLLAHYLTADNASRLSYIQWLEPVYLEELRAGVDASSRTHDVSCSAGKSLPVETMRPTEIAGSDVGKIGPFRRTSDTGKEMETDMQKQGTTLLSVTPLTSKDNYSSSIGMRSSRVTQNDQSDMYHDFSNDQQQNYSKQDSASTLTTLDSRRRDLGPSSTSATSTGPCNQEGTKRDGACSRPLETGAHVREQCNESSTPTRINARGSSLLSSSEAMDSGYDQPTTCTHSRCDSSSGGWSTMTETRVPCNQNRSNVFGQERHSVAVQYNPLKRRLHEERREKETYELENKRLKAEKDDIATTLERKETEMKILHDAYQQQVACEREKRMNADKEAADLRASNEELKKNLQRKESEMKILHDSYQYQIQKEREKREELENELTDLRGSVAFASGVAVRESNIKQEKF